MLHDNIRRQGEKWLERHSHEVSPTRDEPCAISFMAPDPAQAAKEDAANAPITFAGITHHAWQWREGVEISQRPNDAEEALARDLGWKISENQVWRIQPGDGYDPNLRITVSGRTRPADCWLGDWSRQPHTEESAALEAGGLIINPSTTWFICEPREEEE